MRDKLNRELRIYMQLLPLSEKEALNASQTVNIDPSPDNIKRLLEASAVYRAHIELIQFLLRMLSEPDK